MTDITVNSRASAGSTSNSNGGPGNRVDQDNSGAFKPARIPRRTSRDRRGDREDVVAMMKRDMSYSAVASAHKRENSSDEGSSASLLSDSDQDHTNADASRSSMMSRLSSGGGGGSDKEQPTEEEARQEGIEWRRKLVVLLLGVVACLVVVAIAAVSVGIQKEKENQDELTSGKEQQQSEDMITTLENASQEQQTNLQASLKSLANSLTASTPPDQWPFVTNPLLAVQGQSTRALSPAIEFLAFSPLVTASQQVEWQNYSWANQGWIQQDWHYLGNATAATSVNSIAPEIYRSKDAVVETTLGYTAPLWQTSPPPMGAFKLNRDMLSVPAVADLYQQLLEGSHSAVVSPLVSDLPYLYGFNDDDNDDDDSNHARRLGSTRDHTFELIKEDTEEDEASRQWNLTEKDTVDKEENATTTAEIPASASTNSSVARSILLLPVKDALTEDANTVGLLQVVLNWERMLQDLKVPYQKATLQNDCGDDYQFYSDTAQEDTSDPLMLEQSILGPEVGGCSFRVQMELQATAAEDDEEGHDIAGILVLAVVPLAIVLATLGLLLAILLKLFQMVDLRHEKLLKTSAKADAIVASMFPSTIRDRLYADEEEPLKKESSKKESKKESNKKESKKESKKDGSSKRDNKRLRGSTGSKEFGDKGTPETVATADSDSNKLTIPEEGQNLECCPEGHPRITASGSERLKTYLDTGLGADDANYSAPIADLFPNCTVLFADIAGFTAWSSVREPSQVFTLLETLYKKFDDIAKKRHVFKVETVGDCYVAVTGLPEAQEDHALIMVRFARDCMYKSYELTKKLEVTLGPDTAELSMRFGLHSGPVTAGVLRGDRARFQLFGDTVNTASRMESTGQKGRIQMSEETADLLILSGKSHLVRQREDTVTAKGKGEMTTYWLALGADPDDIVEEEMPKPTMLIRNTSGVDSIIEGNEDETESSDDELNDSSVGDNKTVATTKTMLSIRTVPNRRRPPAVSMSGLHSLKALREKKQSKESRLVDWNVEVLGRLLKQVVARRNALGRKAPDEEVKLERPEDQTILEEVREIITLPKFEAARNQEDPDRMDLDPAVKEQLHDYVSTLASMYRENPFHNYEHASHVTMSVVKLLSRIVAPKRTEGQTSEEKIASELHDHTYGITSDPLTQFAVVMSALIHDVDHTGVPNSQLVKENAKVAAYYKNKSVAEQNSVDMSWTLLMEPQFRELRNAIYCDEAELTRFRSLIVNAVMATDIVDKELKQLRNNRWDKAFSGDIPVTEEEVHAAVNRKATIVLEHLIQASDVSHTMQHWHVYRKWNERLFHEMYNAYRAGRAEKDPAEFWYKGEIGFFDFYIIPLAKKLKDCGVFGVSSDEYLNYAMKNREEWERKGEAVTAEMVAKARDKHLATMERQASMRGPLIAEMKAAVLSMRTPQKSSDMFRQPSFRHLRAEPLTTESIAMPHHGFRRQPPRRGTPNRNVKSAVSIGTAERNALKEFRQTHPGGGSPSLRSDMSVGTVETAPAVLGSSPPPVRTPPAPFSASGPSNSMGMRKPVRRGSNIG